MNVATSRLTILIALTAVIVLGGCTAAPPQPELVISESAEADTPSSEQPQPLTSLAQLAGTRWAGEDSDGDFATLVFTPNGTVTLIANGEISEYKEDTWSVDGDVLTFQLYVDEVYGTAVYTGTLDVDRQVIVTTFLTTGNAYSGTLELERAEVG